MDCGFWFFKGYWFFLFLGACFYYHFLKTRMTRPMFKSLLNITQFSTCKATNIDPQRHEIRDLQSYLIMEAMVNGVWVPNRPKDSYIH